MGSSVYPTTEGPKDMSWLNGALMPPKKRKSKLDFFSRGAEFAKGELDVEAYWEFRKQHNYYYQDKYRPDPHILRKQMEGDKTYAKELGKRKKAAKTKRVGAKKAEKSRQKEMNTLRDSINSKEDSIRSAVKKENKGLAEYLKKQLAKGPYDDSADFTKFPKGLDDISDMTPETQALREQYVASLPTTDGYADGRDKSARYEEWTKIEDRVRSNKDLTEKKRRLAELENSSMAPSQPTSDDTTKADNAPAYGKRPKSGWGRITVDEDREGAEYGKGTEFWIDDNGTMIRREPVGGAGKFKVSRKVEGGDWEQKGVMVGNDQDTFVGVTKGSVVDESSAQALTAEPQTLSTRLPYEETTLMRSREADAPLGDLNMASPAMQPTVQYPTERVDAPGEMQLGYEQEDQVPLSPQYKKGEPASSWLPDWLKDDIDTHKRERVNTSRKQQDLDQEEIDQGYQSGPMTGGIMEKERFFGRGVRPPIPAPGSPAATGEPAVRGLAKALAPDGNPWSAADTAKGMNLEDEQWDMAMKWEQYKRDLVSGFFDEYGRLPSVGEMDDIGKQLEYRTKGRFEGGPELTALSPDWY
jgi:hypothetical protein